MPLRGVLVGDSQLKFMCRLRLRLLPFVETCTFSFGGHNAPRLSEAVSRLRCRPADFAVLYVGGNDLDRTGADPQRICDSIKVCTEETHYFVCEGGMDIKCRLICVVGPGDPAAARGGPCRVRLHGVASLLPVGKGQFHSSLAEQEANCHPEAYAGRLHTERRGNNGRARIGLRVWSCTLVATYNYISNVVLKH